MSGDLRPLTPDAIGASVPRRGHWLVAALGRAVLRLIGWQVVGELPNESRAVMIAAPHTSNYDGLVGVSAIQGLRLDIRFMAKHTLFRGPAGWLLRALGGIPVDRARSRGLVEDTKNLMTGGQPFWLGITPEGTRTGADQWKTGFHRIAVDLGLPIIVVTFCYRRKQARILDAFWPSGDQQTDMEAIYAMLDDVQPAHPERLSAPLRRRRH